MKIINKWFKETADYVDKNTGLTIKVRGKDMSSIALVGKLGELTYIDMDITFGDTGMYECGGTILYQGYDDNPTNILGIFKFVKTEKELIELIDKSIATANKLSKNIKSLEQELNN